MTLDDIVTLPLVDELRALLAEYARCGCYCSACRTKLMAKCDRALDEWLERTRGQG